MNICYVCEKRPRVVNRVSKANNKVKEWVYPNVRTMRFSLKGQTSVIRGAVCSKCMKAGKIKKAL